MASRYWKLADIEYVGASLTLSSLWLGYGGTRADVGAAITASSPAVDGAVSFLKDGDVGTTCTFGAAANGSLSVTWDFSVPVDIDSINLAGPRRNEWIRSCSVYTSSDGAVWNLEKHTPVFPWPGLQTLTGFLPMEEWVELWSEDFASGIPGGFATTYVEGGATLGISYNATEQGVELTATGPAAGWLFENNTPKVETRVDLDYDLLVPSYGTARHGVLFYAASRLPYPLSDITYFDYVGGPVVGSGVSSNNFIAQLASTINERSIETGMDDPGTRSFISASPTGPGTKRTYTIGRAGSLVSFNAGLVDKSTAQRPGVFLQYCKILLRSVKVLVPSPGPRWGSPSPTAVAIERKVITGTTPATPLFALERAGKKTFDVLITGGGTGKIMGTVVRDANPDIPWRRLVRLYREQDGLLVDATWSDEATGKFKFLRVDINYSYTTISYDHTGEFDAVLDSGIKMRPNT